jgi:hypothetical protein
MATIAIFGGTGYAGSAIRDEAARRGHTVISVSRQEAEVAGKPDLIARQGNLHDPALVDHMAVEADVLVVAIRAAEQDGVRLADAVGLLAKAAAEHGSRLGFVGGAGSLHVTEGGPRVVDCRRSPKPTRARPWARPMSSPRCARPPPTSTGSTSARPPPSGLPPPARPPAATASAATSCSPTPTATRTSRAPTTPRPSSMRSRSQTTAGSASAWPTDQREPIRLSITARPRRP